MHDKIENIAINQNKKNNLKAGVAAVGGGTIFVVIADCLPENITIKPMLVYLAPTFSIISSAFWLWVLKIHNEYRKNRKLTFVIKLLEEYMSSTMTSKHHKTQLIKRMEELQISVLRKNMKEIEQLFNKETDD